MNPFDSYMLNKVRRLKDVRARYAATGEFASDLPPKGPKPKSSRERRAAKKGE